MQILENEFDFGELIEGQIATHSLIIGNSGEAQLAILDVQTTCSCAVIMPGEKESILVKFNTTGYGGRSFFKTIHIRTNDPENKNVGLIIKSKVVRFARIEPQYILLRSAAKGPINAVSRITPDLRFPFKIVGTVVDPWLSEKIDVYLDTDKNGYTLHVTGISNHAGRFSGHIRLKTDSPFRSELSVFVIGGYMVLKIT